MRLILRPLPPDIAYYTGSTTGTTRDNQICSAYTPITWQVDRRCHMISASSFDKLCYDMKQQRDDMTDDLHAHGPPRARQGLPRCQQRAAPAP